MGFWQRAGKTPGEPENAVEVFFRAGWRIISAAILRLMRRSWQLISGSPRTAPAVPSLYDEARQARREFLWAENCFNSVTEKHLLDYAIYQRLAAESKYSHFLRRLRSEAQLKG